MCLKTTKSSLLVINKIFICIEVDDASAYDWNIREIFKENEFISANNKSKSDFYSDFFQTRLWVKFLEMKKIPEQLMHWVNIKIFDESILK